MLPQSKLQRQQFRKLRRLRELERENQLLLQQHIEKTHALRSHEKTSSSPMPCYRAVRITGFEHRPVHSDILEMIRTGKVDSIHISTSLQAHNKHSATVIFAQEYAALDLLHQHRNKPFAVYGPTGIIDIHEPDPEEILELQILSIDPTPPSLTGQLGITAFIYAAATRVIELCIPRPPDSMSPMKCGLAYAFIPSAPVTWEELSTLLNQGTLLLSPMTSEVWAEHCIVFSQGKPPNNKPSRLREDLPLEKFDIASKLGSGVVQAVRDLEDPYGPIKLCIDYDPLQASVDAMERMTNASDWKDTGITATFGPDPCSGLVEGYETMDALADGLSYLYIGAVCRRAERLQLPPSQKPVQRPFTSARHIRRRE